MAKDLYLTAELKKYYLLDFEQVLLIKDTFWGIKNPFLKSCLIEINNSDELQTLYSRIKKEDEIEDEESYLVLGYFKENENRLQTELESFISTFQSEINSELSFDLMPPSENLNTGSKELQSGAIHNKDYFNIHHFRITCISTNYKEHLRFWKQITSLLINF